jgi:hypothetical protein
VWQFSASFAVKAFLPAQAAKKAQNPPVLPHPSSCGSQRDAGHAFLRLSSLPASHCEEFNGISVAAVLRRITQGRTPMVNDDLVKCPLCGGFTHVDKPELVEALRDPKVRKQVEDYVAQLLAPAGVGPAAVGVGTTEVRDFNKDVHGWNPHVPVWRRSPKE